MVGDGIVEGGIQLGGSDGDAQTAHLVSEQLLADHLIPHFILDLGYLRLGNSVAAAGKAHHTFVFVDGFLIILD